MASKDVIDATHLLQGRIQRVDRGAWDTEGGVDPFAAHHQNGGFDCSHFAHYFAASCFL
jgi:hypothetical protein